MLTELKREAYEANVALPAHGLVHLNFGNASAIDRPRGLIAIKPSGVGYDVLRPADMVLVDLEGRRVEGKLRPSSDTPTHLVLYRAFAHAGGVAHTHSVHATAFAQAGRPIACSRISSSSEMPPKRSARAQSPPIGRAAISSM